MNSLTICMHPKTIPECALSFAQQFRNPLDNINLSVEMLEASFNGTGTDQYELLDQDIQLYLEIIKRSSCRIEELISELPLKNDEAETFEQNHSAAEIHQEIVDIADEQNGDNTN